MSLPPTMDTDWGPLGSRSSRPGITDTLSLTLIQRFLHSLPGYPYLGATRGPWEGIRLPSTPSGGLTRSGPGALPYPTPGPGPDPGPGPGPGPGPVPPRLSSPCLASVSPLETALRGPVRAAGLETFKPGPGAPSPLRLLPPPPQALKQTSGDKGPAWLGPRAHRSPTPKSEPLT